MRRVFAATAVAGVFLPALVAHAQVTVSVDAGANRHAISPLIYGVHFADTPTLLDLNATINRYGGNSAGRYNWNLNVDNRGADFFFESIPYPSAVPGELGDTFISTTKNGGAEPFLTMPMVGWVANTNGARNTLCSFSVIKYGSQKCLDPSMPDCGNGFLGPADPLMCTNGTRLTPPTSNPTDASIPADQLVQQGWVNHVVGAWNTAAKGGLRYWGFDNEPSIWHTVYWDVHNAPADMNEMSGKMIAYGDMIKGVDPTVQILGPEEWGWDGYFFSGKDQDQLSQGLCDFSAYSGVRECPDRAAHAHMEYVPYLLDQLHQHEVSLGKRAIDWLSLHFYPQGGEYAFQNACNDVANQPLRNRSTRGLWDPNYVNESYIGTLFPPGDPGNIVRLIPRMKEWVSTYYPGLKVGLTEYNWGAECEIGGATAQADLLGIFGREGLDMAIRWTVPGVTYPCGCPNPTSYKAFKMYRNYDGANSTFGDTSVSATVPNPDTLAAFAAHRSSDGFLTIMVINKVATSAPTTIQLANFNASTSEVWQLTSANAINHLANIPIAGMSFGTTLPGQSITLFVVHGTGGGTPTADLAITKTDGRKTASPLDVLTYTITATNYGPDPVTGATVTDVVPASLQSVQWTCAGAGGGRCTAGPVAGSINDTVNLPVGASVTYSLMGTVIANPSNLRNTATISAPSGVTDPNLANNTATDDDLLLCFGETVVVPDGRVAMSTIGAGSTAWFASSIKIGNSYSVELKNTMDASGAPGMLTVYTGDDGCSGTTTLTSDNTTGIDPGATGGAVRVSFTATGIESFFRAQLMNGAGVTIPFSFSWSDTTMFSPAWSTNGSFDTFYSFQNTTGTGLSGTLTLLDTSGAVLSAFPVSIPASQTASTSTAALGVTRNRTGTAKFTHNGPPGSIVPEAAIANFGLNPAYVQPVQFQAVREGR